MNTSKTLTLLALSSLAGIAHGAGFYLSEIGTPGSLGTAGVANPVNDKGADAAWANPAGLTGLDQNQMVLGSQLIVPQRRFDSDIAEAGGGDGGTSDPIAFVPSAFYAHQLSDNLTAGFAIVGAMGGGDKFDSDWAGRYGAIEVSLQGLSISPSLGYKINEDLSIGVGLSVIYTMFYQEVAINLPGPVPDGSAEFDDLDDWGYQPFFGLTYQINERTLFGLVYRAEMDVELEGDLNLEGVPPFADEVELDWDNPQWLEIGLRYQLNEEWIMALNLGWQEWSTFSENIISVPTGQGSQEVVINRDWDDTWHAGIAFSRLTENSAFSLGFSYESSPVSDSNRTIDFAVDEQFKLSGAYAWSLNDNWNCSVGMTAIISGDAPVDQITQGERLKGDFSTNLIFIGGFTAQRKF